MVGAAAALVAWACGGSNESETAPRGSAPGGIDLEDLQSWTRVDGPVLRDYELQTGYEVASDIHVFRDDEGVLRAVYTGPNPAEDISSIKLASAADHTSWAPGPVVLSSIASPMSQLHKETAIYRRSASGRHQIFYIGYADPEVYEAQIFLAEADEVSRRARELGAAAVHRRSSDRATRTTRASTTASAATRTTPKAARKAGDPRRPRRVTRRRPPAEP